MSRPERPPLAAYGAAFVALAALAVTARGLPLLGVFAAAILLSWFWDARLRDHTKVRWALRLGLIAAVWILSPTDPMNPYEQFGPARSRDIFGQICAAEMALQFWRYRSHDPRRSLLAISLMSGLTLLAASNTFEETYVRYLTPLYLVCILFAARSYRARQPGAAARATSPGTDMARIAALMVVLGVGAVGYRVTLAKRGDLTDWSNQAFFRLPFNMNSSGMAAQPTLGSAFGLRGSPMRVFRIAHFVGDTHLCGVTYDSYEQGRWGPAVNELHWRSLPDADVRSPYGKSSREFPTDMRVTRLSNDNTLIFYPLATASLDLGDATDISQGSDGGPIRARAPAPYDYVVSVAGSETYQGVMAQPLTAAERARCLELPLEYSGIREVRELAQHVTRGKKSERARLNALVDFLMSHYRYSLWFRSSGQRLDPVADFLLNVKHGHCEFFASSAALLLRSVGIPTRYVTGYYAHEIDLNQSVIVRGRDAHAWCQAWIDTIGWVTVDATPYSGRPDAIESETPIEPWRRAYEWFQDKTQALGDVLSNLSQEQKLAALAGIAAISGGGFYLRSRRSRAKPAVADAPTAYTEGEAALRELVRRFEVGWMRRAGAPFVANRTYSEHLHDPDVLTSTGGGLIEQARAIAAQYEIIRFGGKNDENRLSELERRITDLESSHD